MPRSAPQRAGSPRRLMHLPAVAAVGEDQVGQEVLPHHPVPPRVQPRPVGAPPETNWRGACRPHPPANGYLRVNLAQRRRTLELDTRAPNTY